MSIPDAAHIWLRRAVTVPLYHVLCILVVGTLPATLAANWLAGAWDQNTGLWAGSPVGSALEIVSLRWLRELLDLDDAWGGAFVTGATMANFTCLAAALMPLGQAFADDRLVFGIVVGEVGYPLHLLEDDLGIIEFIQTFINPLILELFDLLVDIVHNMLGDQVLDKVFNGYLIVEYRADQF